MHFFNWKSTNSRKTKRDKQKHKAKNKKKKVKGKMYGSSGSDYNSWEKDADGIYKLKEGTNYSGTYVGKTCTHPPYVGCQVGDYKLFPTQDKFITPAVLADFDVVCPLTDFGGGVNYNEYCGVIMWIPIKDMTAPDYLRLRANAERIVELMKAGNTIALWCIGSHGRTGTVLATCIGLVEPNVDPIDTVRERHCKSAVETQSQVEVVFKALGRELPEKWKPAPTPVRKVKSYITEGKSWVDDKTPTYLVSGAQPCEYCGKYGSYNDVVHWYGHVRAHTDCYNEEQAKIAKEKADKNTVIDVPKIPEAVLGVGGEIIIPFDEALLEEDPALASDEDLINIIKSRRPFFNKWSKAYKDQITISHIGNRKDSFGDIICYVCDRLVINPLESEFHTLEENVNFLAHKKCETWLSDTDTEVLCGHCLINPAEEDGFCSMTCASLGAFDKAKLNNENEIRKDK
jgi:hypothetical protein